MSSMTRRTGAGGGEARSGQSGFGYGDWLTIARNLTNMFGQDSDRVYSKIVPNRMTRRVPIVVSVLNLMTDSLAYF